MGFKISVNDEEVWESDGDANLVDRVSVTNARGEVTSIGSPGQDTWLKINVNIRNAPSDAGTYLDIVEEDKAQERRERIEGDSADAVAEGRAQMDAEAEEAQREQEEQEETEEEKPEFGPPAPGPIPDLEM